MTENNVKEDTIDASPTKELFINILTRDISLKDCILDLIDNSIDSYIRRKYTNKRKIELTLTEEKFIIYDNCGGISHKYLKENVFKFGVEKLTRDVPTLGVYGIGLKRAIFKIGNNFEMETDDSKELSNVTFKVNEWKEKKNVWTLPSTYQISKLKSGDEGHTKITINELYPNIKKKFLLNSFIADLIESISITYSLIIKNNIDIYVNGKKIESFPLDLTLDEVYSPSRVQKSFDGIKIDVICGINPRRSRSDKMDLLGWNIFFNNRLIVRNDRTESTGWTGDKDEKADLPKFHPIFNEFKGLVFINSDDPSKLPLNTSKNGLSMESEIYHDILNLMIEQAKPVIKYLSNKYNEERTQIDEIEEQVEETIEEVKEEVKSPIESIEVGSKFSAPKRIEPKETLVTINYKKTKEIIEKIKKIEKLKTG